MRTIEDIRAAAKAAREESAKVLTAEQRDMVIALADEEDAKALLAAEKAKARALDMADRVDRATLAAKGDYIVDGVDLIALFPVGKSPTEHIPSGGVIIIRSPTTDASDALAREMEANKQGLSAMAIRYVCDNVVDPREGADGVLLGEFFKRYQEAAGSVAVKIRDLGGAKLAADKRGRG